jgi:hypothetical protein
MQSLSSERRQKRALRSSEQGCWSKSAHLDNTALQMFKCQLTGKHGVRGTPHTWPSRQHNASPSQDFASSYTPGPYVEWQGCMWQLQQQQGWGPAGRHQGATHLKASSAAMQSAPRFVALTAGGVGMEPHPALPACSSSAFATYGSNTYKHCQACAKTVEQLPTPSVLPSYLALGRLSSMQLRAKA